MASSPIITLDDMAPTFANLSAQAYIRGFLRDCALRGWDSYDAEPLTEDVVERACRALEAFLPGYTFWPVPCSDGGISFEGTGEWDGVDLKVEP